MGLTLFHFAAGLALLLLGAEALVRGASRLALRLGLKPVVVGLTVVAVGTSSPEMIVSVKAAWFGRADVSLGNVVGSNIMNVLFILGASALLAPLAVTRRLIWTEVPVMLGAGLLLLLLAADGRVGRLDGLALSGLLAVYLGAQVRRAMREEGGGAGLPQPTAGGWPTGSAACIGLAAAGLVLLVAGAAWLIDAAVAIARALGLSELIIGLTVVAFGTSLPEAATSLLAAWRGERDIAVGNVVGSNIFNILGVLGASALVSAGGVAVSPAALWFDLPVMLAASLACLPIFATGHVINRWEGALFLFYYAAYVAYLILEALDHDAQAAFGWTMLAFVIPLTAATLAVTLYRHFRRPASAR